MTDMELYKHRETGETAYEYEVEDRVEEMLNEVYEPLTVDILTYEAGRVLREIDPIAFREVVLEVINAEWDEVEDED